MNIIKNTPIPISGLMLALFSLGAYMNNFIDNSIFIFGIIAFCILILLVLKSLIYPENIKNELSNVIILSTSGTFSMALMMFSTYFININNTISFVIWTVGVLLHLSLIIYFTIKYNIYNFSLENVYPTYWIVYIGITMASITGSTHMGMFNWIFFIMGFISMIPTIILVTYRYYKLPVKNDASKPLICIYTAIYSILIVGYVNSFADMNYSFLLVIYSIAFVLYFFALYKFIEYRHLTFYPSYSAYSFPFVISTVATYNVYYIIGWSFLKYIVIFESVTSVAIVCYVLYSYLINIYLKKG